MIYATCIVVAPPREILSSSLCWKSKMIGVNMPGWEMRFNLSIFFKLPNEETKVEARMIWKVLLFKEEKSKKGSFSSWSWYWSLMAIICHPYIHLSICHPLYIHPSVIHTSNRKDMANQFKAEDCLLCPTSTITGPLSKYLNVFCLFGHIYTLSTIFHMILS